MHILRCPYCNMKFKAAKPLVNVRVKCPKCGKVFTGSTVEQASKTDHTTAVDRPVELTMPIAKRGYSPKVILAMIGLFVGVAGALGLGAWGIYLASHPKVIIKSESGEVIESKRVSKEEAEERIKEILSPVESVARKPRATLQPARTTGARPSATIKKSPIPATDKKLKTQWAIVYSDIAEKYYLCGVLRSSYSKPLVNVWLTAYINGAVGPSRSYPFVPPEGEIRFCLPLGEQQVNPDDVKVVARCKPANKDTIVWSVDTDQMEWGKEGTKVIWMGTVRNTTSMPVKDVRIYCNFFDDDGIEAPGGARIGRITTGRTIGIGKIADFQVELDTVGAEVYKTIVARAVGRRY